MSTPPRIEYVEARRVLLDVLSALRDQLDAIVLVGAQAVYLRTAGRMPTYQPFTTDADIVVDPSRLNDTPGLGEVMRSASFVLTSEPGIWEARFRRPGIADEVSVPVDLIVPMEVAVGPGRRSAHLAGEHGRHSARQSEGLEGALVDRGPLEVRAVDPADDRSFVINVAGEGAMLVAKLHKLGDRLAKPNRLDAKDAGDVYRLFDVVAPDDGGHAHEPARRREVGRSDLEGDRIRRRALRHGNRHRRAAGRRSASNHDSRADCGGGAHRILARVALIALTVDALDDVS